MAYGDRDQYAKPWSIKGNYKRANARHDKPMKKLKAVVDIAFCKARLNLAAKKKDGWTGCALPVLIKALRTRTKVRLQSGVRTSRIHKGRYRFRNFERLHEEC
jgi:hypothetical protein